MTSRYVLFEDGSVGFEVGSYDASRELVIDPILSYGTYLGGSGGEQIWNMGAGYRGERLRDRLHELRPTFPQPGSPATSETSMSSSASSAPIWAP